MPCPGLFAVYKLKFAGMLPAVSDNDFITAVFPKGKRAQVLVFDVHNRVLVES